jgi:hypothetical protein
MGLIYLTQAGKVTGYDYEAVAIENEISELSAKRDDLAVENARMTSVAASRDSDVAANMVDGSVGGYVAE